MENELSPELERAMREELDEESLALYDLLKKQKTKLSKEEEDAVKKVAKDILDTLKAEKLKLAHSRESTQVNAQVKVVINQSLQYLPQEPYPDDELELLSQNVYRHIHSHYQGAGMSSYGCFG